MQEEQKIFNAPHGRETYIAYFGDDFVMKRPLPSLNQKNKDDWLAKQHRTKDIIDELKCSKHSVSYNIPSMVYIKDDEYQLLEEYAHGEPLTKDLYYKLSKRQQIEIITGISSFLVDMNELKPVKDEEIHKIADEIKMQRFANIISKKMPKWFEAQDIQYMEHLYSDVQDFEYITRKAWSHSDLNANNVLYDFDSSKLSFIDFAETNYNFIYRDIFSPLNLDLDICKNVYELYTQLHDKDLYRMPGIKNPDLQKIMKFRTLTILLKRFIYAGDNLRLNPQYDKTVLNNAELVRFMSELIKKLKFIEAQIIR